jgi:hypothetical protein
MTERLGKNHEQVVRLVWNFWTLEWTCSTHSSSWKKRVNIKRREYCRHHQSEDANYSQHPHKIKSYAHLTATVSDRSNSICRTRSLSASAFISTDKARSTLSPQIPEHIITMLLEFVLTRLYREGVTGRSQSIQYWIYCLTTQNYRMIEVI